MLKPPEQIFVLNQIINKQKAQMKGVKIISIVTLVVVVGVLGFVIYSHIKKNKDLNESRDYSPVRSFDENEIIA